MPRRSTPQTFTPTPGAESGAWTIKSHPSDKHTIKCKECDRRGTYSRASLAAKYGEDTAMPHVLTRVAADGGCERAQNPTGLEACRAVFELPVKL